MGVCRFESVLEGWRAGGLGVHGREVVWWRRLGLLDGEACYLVR